MTAPESSENRPTLFARMFGTTRYVMTVAVFAVFLGATVLLVDGIVQMAGAIRHSIFGRQVEVDDSVSLRIEVIEAVDVILVATVLFVIAFGLYQLFVDPTLRSTLPPWLRISAISSLEVRLAGMVVTVLSIIALTQALESHGGAASEFGYEIAAIIAAISLFLYQESRHHRAEPTSKNMSEEPSSKREEGQ
jgi:uncharacterized membrane protein YqhA